MKSNLSVASPITGAAVLALWPTLGYYCCRWLDNQASQNAYLVVGVGIGVPKPTEAIVSWNNNVTLLVTRCEIAAAYDSANTRNFVGWSIARDDVRCCHPSRTATQPISSAFSL